MEISYFVDVELDMCYKLIEFFSGLNMIKNYQFLNLACVPFDGPRRLLVDFCGEMNGLNFENTRWDIYIA